MRIKLNGSKTSSRSILSHFKVIYYDKFYFRAVKRGVRNRKNKMQCFYI